MRATTCVPLAVLLLALSHPAAAQEPPATNLTHPEGGYHPTWSPDGTQIAFAATRSSNSGIWVVPAIGGLAVQITPPSSPEYYTHYDPAWSPSGDEIAYVSWYHGWPYDWWGIGAVPAQGGVPRGLTGSPGADRDPSWSPDATQIAFARYPHIRVMPATGEPPPAIYLTSEGNGNTDPAWSPDGTEIAFSRLIGGDWDIWVIPATGEPATRLLSAPGHEADPAWSPDGSWVAFATDAVGNFDIWALHVGAVLPIQITSDPGDDRDPAWSPDGTQIAFTSNRDGDNDVWVMDLTALGVEPGAAAPPPTRVRFAASPNPFHDATSIELSGAEGGAALRILDVAGRLVREIQVPAGTSAGTAWSLVWDGRDAGGLDVAPGVYYLAVGDLNHGATGRVVRMR